MSWHTEALERGKAVLEVGASQVGNESTILNSKGSSFAAAVAN